MIRIVHAIEAIHSRVIVAAAYLATNAWCATKVGLPEWWRRWSEKGTRGVVGGRSGLKVSVSVR